MDTRITPDILEEIIESLPYGIVLVSKDKKIHFSNTSFKNFFCNIKTDLTVLVMALSKNRKHNLLEEIKEKEDFLERELIYGDEKKNIYRVLVKNLSRAIENGQELILFIFEDISGTIAFQTEVIYSEKTAAMIELARCVAHELGNILYSMNTTLQFLRDEKIRVDTLDLSSDIDLLIDNVKKMDRLLSSLLNFTASEKIAFVKGDIREVIDRSILSISRGAYKRHVRLETRFPENIPLLPMDRRQMEALFLNLFKNALEATEEGGRIWVHVTYDMPQETPGHITVEVGNTGISMSEEDLKHIFKPFFSRKKEGHGLGLYICQKIVERHNGEISVRSEKDRGTVFTLKFPFQCQLIKKAF